LQAFSTAYFRGEKPFSYSRENLLASQSLQERNAQRPPFFAKPLAAPEEDWRTVSLDDLAAFFCNPCEFLLTRRVGLRLPQLEERTEDREPFSINALDGYFLKQELVKARLTGIDPNALQRIIKGSAQLPVGEIGDVTYESFQGEAEEFVQRLSPLLPGKFSPPIDVDFELGKFHITGRIDGITERGLIRYRCSKIKAADLLRLWIPHLAWSALRPKGQCYQTIYVGSDETLLFQPVENANAVLNDLLAMYWRGLSLPLKFFPQTSLAFVETTKAKEERNGKTNPLEAALKKWVGDDYNHIRGDANNPYNSLCFGNEAPLDQEFQETALTVFGPILAHGGSMP
jgi:exodeoxyribonuclease V gamma subunit